MLQSNTGEYRGDRMDLLGMGRGSLCFALLLQIVAELPPGPTVIDNVMTVEVVVFAVGNKYSNCIFLIF